MDYDAIARFELKYLVEPNSGCWIWTAGDNGVGYGLFYLDGRRRLAHRVSYEHHVGPIPDGLVIDHICRTPSCVNPAHLEPVTQRENLIRGDGPSLAGTWQRERTHCPAGHAYDERNTRVENSGGRSCRECSRIKSARTRQDSPARAREIGRRYDERNRDARRARCREYYYRKKAEKAAARI